MFQPNKMLRRPTLQRRFWLATLQICMLVFLAMSVVAQEWTERQCVEPAPGKEAGWTVEVPSKWVSVEDLDPPPPLSDGFRSPEGKAWTVVSWVGKSIPASELSTLEQKGFQQKRIRIAGHDAFEYNKARANGGFDRVLYVRSPKGTCRIMLGTSAAEFSTQLEHITASFRFLELSHAAGGNAWKSIVLEGITFSCPAAWKADQDEGATILSSNGKKAVTVRSLIGPPRGQSFRGFARAAGQSHISQAQKLAEFQPFRTDSGTTGYLAVWILASGGHSALVAYLPGPSGKTLALTLHDSVQRDTFQRLLQGSAAGQTAP